MVNKSDYQLKIDTYHAYILILNCLLKIVVTINSRPNKHYFNRIWQPRHSGGIRDLNSFKDMQQLKAQRIKHNINKISGGYIAAVTTF